MSRDSILVRQNLAVNITVPFDGDMYIYTANESTVSECYFDEVQIVHDKLNSSLQVTASADYDPFGYLIDGTRYVNTARLANNYLYQGNYSEFDEVTGWNRFELRGNYDSRLGRWHSADPYGQYASPFVGMGNNPINGVDPDGGLFLGPGLKAFFQKVKNFFVKTNSLDKQAYYTGKNVAYKGAAARTKKGIFGQIGDATKAVTKTVSYTANQTVQLTNKALSVAAGQGNSLANNLSGGWVPRSDPSDAPDPVAFKDGQDFGDNITLPVVYFMMTFNGGSPGPTPSYQMAPISTVPLVRSIQAPSLITPVHSVNSNSKDAEAPKIPKGFKEVKDFGYQHGQKVYEYKGKYYSRDIDGHNGGIWKVFRSMRGRLKRIGTADQNLKIFKE